jgi:uncharacterized protein YacL
MIFFRDYINDVYRKLGKRPSRRKRERAKTQIRDFAAGAGTLIGFTAIGQLGWLVAAIFAIMLTPSFIGSIKTINNKPISAIEKEKEKLVCEYITSTFAGFLCSIWLAAAMLWLAMFPFTVIITLLCVAFPIILIVFANRNKIKFKSQTNKEACENMLWGMICALGCEISTQLGYIVCVGTITFGDIFGVIFTACMAAYIFKRFRK